MAAVIAVFTPAGRLSRVARAERTSGKSPLTRASCTFFSTFLPPNSKVNFIASSIPPISSTRPASLALVPIKIRPSAITPTTTSGVTARASAM